MDFKLDQYFMWIHAYYYMQVTDGMGNYEGVSYESCTLINEGAQVPMVLPIALDTNSIWMLTWLHVCFIDYSLLLMEPLKLAICSLAVDKTERVSKFRGNRYTSLFGANVYGCDFTDFWLKLSERKAILMICNPFLVAPDSEIYCFRTGTYCDLLYLFLYRAGKLSCLLNHDLPVLLEIRLTTVSRFLKIIIQPPSNKHTYTL